MNNAKRIALSCACGAALGTLLAVVMCDVLAWSRYCWPAGALVGGVIAYLGFNLREVKDAIVTAWRENLLSEMISPLPAAAWRLVRFLAPFVGGFVFSATTWFVILWQSHALADESVKNILMTAGNFGLYSCLLGSLCLGFSAFIIQMWSDVIIATFTKKKLADDWLLDKIFLSTAKESDAVVARRFLLIGFWCPISVPLLMAIFLLSIVPALAIVMVATGYEIFRLLFRTGRPIIELVWMIFKLIHSDLRMLCLVDATIGATVGYFGGPRLTAAILPALNLPLAVLVWMTIGAGVGAAWGLLNYELISIRWLKLVPVKAAAE